MAANGSRRNNSFAERLADMDEAIRARRFERNAAFADESASSADQSVDLSGAVACLERLENLWPRNRSVESTPGNCTLGDFRLVREVGHGGMGVVYEARQLSLSRRVALKILPFASVLDDRQIQRFKNESLAAAQLDHPHIVHVHGTGCDRGVHYYAMQFIEGQTLAQAIAEMRRLQEPRDSEMPERDNSELLTVVPDPHAVTALFPHESNGDGATTDPKPPVANKSDTAPVALLSTERTPNSRAYLRRIAEIGIQVAESLDYAHSVGIVHRDIKPSNLLLDRNGNVYVTDFGLAHIEAEAGLTLTGDVFGTLRYMSPEQAQGLKGAIDYRSDIYSLGVTLYELLTLQPAYPDTDRRRLLHQVANEAPKLPRQINPQIPKDLETIVLKAIDKVPTMRYASAAELAQDLRHFLLNEPITARRATLRQRCVKWAQRYSRWLLAAVGACLVAVIGLSIAIFEVNIALDGSQENERRATLEQRKASRNARQATKAREKAQSNLREAVKTVDKLLTRVAEEKLFATPGATRVRRQLLEDAASQLDALGKDASDPLLQEVTADAFKRVAGIYQTFGDLDFAIHPARRAKRIYTRLGSDTRMKRKLSDVQFVLATTYWLRGKYPDALRESDIGLTMARELVQHFPNSEPDRFRLADQLRHRAFILNALGQFKKIRRCFIESNEVLGSIPDASPQPITHRLMLSRNLTDLGRFEGRFGNSNQAMKYFLEAKSRQESILAELIDESKSPRKSSHGGLGPLPPIRQMEWVLAETLEEISHQHFIWNQKATAKAKLERAILLLERIEHEFPDIVFARTELAKAYTSLAIIMESMGRDRDAEQVYRTAAAVALKVPDSAQHWVSNRLAWCLVVRPRDAELSRLAATLAQKALAAQRNPHTLSTVGISYYRVGRWKDSIDALLESDRMGKHENFSRNAYFIAMSYWKRGNKNESLKWYRLADSWMVRHAPNNGEVIRFRNEARTVLEIRAGVQRPK